MEGDIPPQSRYEESELNVDQSLQADYKRSS